MDNPTMSEPSATGDILAICEKDTPAADAVRVHLAASGLQATAWYKPRDVAEVGECIRAGGVRVVIFPTAEDALTAIWDGRANLDTWQEAGTCLACATPPAASPEAWLSLVERAWSGWRHRQRRQQIVACLVLSIAALAAAFGLLLLA
jgi:hypothetical protein